MEGGDVASKTYPIQASAVKKGGFLVIKGRPTKVTEMTTSKTGKHGHAKVHFYGTDIFTGKKLEDLCPSTHNMEAPNVKRTDLPLTDIDDEDYLQLMEEDGTLKSNLQLPEGDLGKEIRDAFDNDDGAEIICTVQEAMGEEMVVAWKFDK